MSESNNNNNYCADNYDVNMIRNQSDEIKLDFIRNVSAQVEIPVAFKPSWNTNGTRKLFYPIKDGKEQNESGFFLKKKKTNSTVHTAHVLQLKKSTCRRHRICGRISHER